MCAITLTSITDTYIPLSFKYHVGVYLLKRSRSLLTCTVIKTIISLFITVDYIPPSWTRVPLKGKSGVLAGKITNSWCQIISWSSDDFNNWGNPWNESAETISREEEYELHDDHELLNAPTRSGIKRRVYHDGDTIGIFDLQIWMILDTHEALDKTGYTKKQLSAIASNTSAP